MGTFDDDWGHVSNSSGEYAQMNSLTGHLLIIFPIGYIEHSQTKFTVPGKKSDVVICDVIDLDEVDETGTPGKIYRGQWWRGAFLIAGLRPRIGGKVLGRLGKGVARNGMNAPWVVNDMVSDETCLERAKAWGRAHSDFEASTFQPPTAAPAAPAPQQQYPSNYGGQTVGQGPGYPAPASTSSNGYPPPPNAYPPPPPGYDPYAGQSYPPATTYPPQGGYPPAPQQGGYPEPPRFPVPGSGSPQEQQMLEAMRHIQRDRQGVPQASEPPF